MIHQSQTRLALNYKGYNMKLRNIQVLLHMHLTEYLLSPHTGSSKFNTYAIEVPYPYQQYLKKVLTLSMSSTARIVHITNTISTLHEGSAR